MVALGFYVLAAVEGWAHYVAFPLYLLVVVFTFVTAAQYLRRAAFAVAFVAVVIGYGAGFLAHLDSPTIAPVLSFLLLLELNDAFGYLVGGIIGKTRPFPILSPRKSVEGYLGGAFGIAVGLLLLVEVIGVLPHPAFSLLLVLGIGAWVIGNIGDLLFSAVKRGLGIKDFGTILPGHGGILDRFDNVLFGSPVFFLIWHLFVH